MKYAYKDIYTIYFKLGQHENLWKNYIEYKKIDRVYFEYKLNEYDKFVFINNIKTEKLIEKIKKYSEKIKLAIEDVFISDPNIYEEFIHDLATKEIQNSFQIDGMYFDIFQFKDVLNTRDYLLTLKEQEENFNYTNESVRNLYDLLFKKKNKYLDKYTPEMFRFGSKYINNKNLISNIRNDNIEVIKSELNGLHTRLKNEDQSDFTKALLYHYIFEWIHPFYDGNGRIGRLILVSQLYTVIGFPALYLSNALLENISKYFEIFAPIKHPFDISEKDITVYVNHMLEIMKTKFKELELNLNDKKLKYWSYLETIKDCSKTEYMILKSTALINIFIEREAIILDLEKITGLKKPTIAYQIKKLCQDGYLVNISSGKIKHLVINSGDFQF